MGCVHSDIDSVRNDSKFTIDNQFKVCSKIMQDDDVALKAFIDAGYMINFRMPAFSRRTALHISADYGSVKCVRLLLALKADVNQKDNYEITPIMLATKNESEEIVNMLLKCRATTKGRTTFDTTIVDYVPKNKKREHFRKALSLGRIDY